MGRGINSKAVIRQGEISCISCPCGWEISVVMCDDARTRKIANLKSKLHKKKCDKVVNWNNTYNYDITVPYARNAQRNIQHMRREGFQDNIDKMKSRAEEKMSGE